jgi:heat shock protein HslJ
MTGAVKSLAGTTWQVESIGGAPVIDPAKTELRFEPDGSVSGSTGCNRFSGKATLEGAVVRFSPLAMTRMACAPEVNDQEMRFTQALAGVAGWTTDASGAVQLAGADGKPLMKLTRAGK